jgi:hypothetical protein
MFGLGCAGPKDKLAVTEWGSFVQLRLVKQELDLLEFAWRFTNPYGHSVYVPCGWGYDPTCKEWDEPVMLPIPRTDLLVAYGEIGVSSEQTESKGMTGTAIWPQYERVEPRGTLEQRFQIKLPFEAPEHEREGLGGIMSVFQCPALPFDPERGHTAGVMGEREAELTELATVWFAVQYSLVSKYWAQGIAVGPNAGLPDTDEACNRLWRAAVIDEAMHSSKRALGTFSDDPIATRIAISNPVKIRIRLAKPVKLYYQEEPRLKH